MSKTDWENLQSLRHLAMNDELSAKETEFILSMTQRGESYTMSEKQQSWFDDLVVRHLKGDLC